MGKATVLFTADNQAAIGAINARLIELSSQFEGVDGELSDPVLTKLSDSLNTQRFTVTVASEWDGDAWMMAKVCPTVSYLGGKVICLEWAED